MLATKRLCCYSLWVNLFKMNVTLGTLDFSPATDHEDLLAQSVGEAVVKLNDARVQAAPINAALSDTAAFCEQYQIELKQAANCVVLEAKRADRVWYAAFVVLAHTRADVNGLIRKSLDARKVSFAPMEFAVDKTGMEYGAITPVGLPEDWPILIDKRVADSTYVVIGSGVRHSKLAIPGSILATLPNVQVISSLANEV